MKILTILNNQELRHFMWDAQSDGVDVYSIKGKAPEGSTYDDGELIINDVNIAWVRADNGKRIDIIYG